MLIMRFNRTGKKNRVSYRIVLQEHTAAPGKRHVEILGSHDPHSKITTLKEERIQHWLKEGVQTSDAVYNLLVTKGIITGDKRAKKIERPEPKVEEKAEEVAEATPEATESAPAEEVTPEAEVVTEEKVEAPAEATPELTEK